MGAMAGEHKYSGGVEVTLQGSRRLAAFVVAAAAATLALLAATPLPPGIAIALATAVACLALPALREARRTRRLAIDRDGAVSVDGVAGRLASGSFVAPWLTIVHWRPAGARFDRTLPVLPDMAPEPARRELRVILRMS